MDRDERPDGWGICCICGEDCADESDYNAQTRTSTHRACEDRAPKERQPEPAAVGRGQE